MPLCGDEVSEQASQAGPSTASSSNREPRNRVAGGGVLLSRMTAKVPVASREYALNLYRQLLSFSKRLPAGQQRDDAVRGVREKFRANAEVTDPTKASLAECV